MLYLIHFKIKCLFYILILNFWTKRIKFLHRVELAILWITAKGLLVEAMSMERWKIQLLVKKCQSPESWKFHKSNISISILINSYLFYHMVKLGLRQVDKDFLLFVNGIDIFNDFTFLHTSLWKLIS